MQVSVLQWNISYQEDICNVVTLLRQYKPDIICLQELTLNYEHQQFIDTPAWVAKELGYNYVCKDYPMVRDIRGANGIFTRFPICSSRFVWTATPNGAGDDSDEHRVYIEADLTVEGSRLTVGTTHMHYTHRLRSTSYKRQETDRLMTELNKHDKNFVFTGDLNATPHSYTVKQITKHLKNAGPDFSQKTWTTKPFSYNGFKENTLNWRLDYVLVSRNLKSVESRVIRTEYSDHLPILATLKIK